VTATPPKAKAQPKADDIARTSVPAPNASSKAKRTISTTVGTPTVHEIRYAVSLRCPDSETTFSAGTCSTDPST
jgi:hypothetical protein